MSSFLTDGRTALMAALRADAAVVALVRTWRAFGPGPHERLIVEPAYCTLLALYPATGDTDPRFNAADQINQDLVVRVVTDGKDAAQAEELVGAVLDRINACRETLLGMASAGLKDLRATSLRWDPVPSREAPRILWDVTVQVRLEWIRGNRP